MWCNSIWRKIFSAPVEVYLHGKNRAEKIPYFDRVRDFRFKIRKMRIIRKLLTVMIMNIQRSFLFFAKQILFAL